MTRYNMSDGTIVDTSKSSKQWKEETEWDGNNHISCATGCQWDHETLYRSRRGRYYVVHDSQYQCRREYAEWLSNEEAVRWLSANGYFDDDSTEEIPEELTKLVDELTE